MEQDLEQKIIQANIELHQKSAQYYDQIHPEIFNKNEQNLIENILSQAISQIKKDKINVLDLGAGTGNITLKLLDNEKVGSVVAVDLSKEMLDELEKKAGQNPKLKIANKPADIFLMDDDSKYDLIVISSVLHHLPDYFQTIATVLEKLDDGGVFIIFHEPTGEKSKLISFLEWLDSRIFVNLFLPQDIKKVAKSLDHTYSDYHVYHKFDLAGVKKFFEEEEDIEIIFFKKHNTFDLLPFRWLGKTIPAKNNFILAVRKK
ncbi:MAG: class I SAM-dependent methyltransferase [Candidatus Parcubacteria bacterium]|nr:class I SAM-dependent methyltransferase [Candidatus Parcubacteria bacterium]